MRCNNCNNGVANGVGFCPYCGASLSGVSNINVPKGQRELDPVRPQKPENYPPVPQQPPQTNNTVKIMGIAAITLIILLVAAYFGIHSYSEATCTEPATCTICGKTNGYALGHNWREATRETPQTCTRCGEVTGDVLPASTGVTENGQTRQLSADELSSKKAGTKKFTIRKGSTLAVAPMALDTPIENCVQATVHIGWANVKEGNVKGDWGFWVRENGDTWTLMDKFEYEGTEMDMTFTFDTPVSFDRYAVGYYEARSKFSYNASYKMTDAWVAE